MANFPSWMPQDTARYKPPSGRPSSLEGWIDKYKSYISSGNRNIIKFQSSIKNEMKKKKPNRAKIEWWNKQISNVKKEIGRWNDEIASTQNKIYVREGQYDKLLGGTERDSFLAIKALFRSYGLESLSGKIYDYVKNGYSGDTISLLLQDTKEYKERFAGNEARVKAGLPVLNPGEYLAVEASYRQTMESAGMPKGFYDSPSDFNGLIAKNVSPSEIQNRVDLAVQATTLGNPMYRKALNQMGISDSELTAYFLDPKRAMPFLQKSAATAAIGGQALKQGLTFDKAYAEQLALQGIGQEEAMQGYSQIATELESMKNLAKIYGEEWTQRTSEQALFEGSAEAVKQKGRLLSRERGQFTGAVGAARAGLAQRGGQR